ncbi:MAG TPA: response regulator transcription factor [Tepidiformaceae bacterium]|nr:response regulator transcription factor [Tepidiformaceae bacterium]
MQLPSLAEGEYVVPVVVVSPSPAVRSGLRALTDGRDGIVVVAESIDLLDDTGEPAAVIVGEAADFTLAEWREAAESRAVVLLGARESLLPYRGLLRAPAGLLLREASADEITAAVLAAARGLSVLDPSLADALPLVGAIFAEGGAASPLTHREVDVLRLVAAGLPNKAIALQLHISDHTVKFHMGSIMSKLDASSRTEAVTLAVRQGILPL